MAEPILGTGEFGQPRLKKAAMYLRLHLGRRGRRFDDVRRTYPWFVNVATTTDGKLIISATDVGAARRFIALHGDWLGYPLAVVGVAIDGGQS